MCGEMFKICNTTVADGILMGYENSVGQKLVHKAKSITTLDESNL